MDRKAMAQHRPRPRYDGPHSSSFVLYIFAVGVLHCLFLCGRIHHVSGEQSTIVFTQTPTTVLAYRQPKNVYARNIAYEHSKLLFGGDLLEDVSDVPAITVVGNTTLPFLTNDDILYVYVRINTTDIDIAYCMTDDNMVSARDGMVRYESGVFKIPLKMTKKTLTYFFKGYSLPCYAIGTGENVTSDSDIESTIRSSRHMYPFGMIWQNALLNNDHSRAVHKRSV